jgi:CheY-like chemotaxis protein
MGGEIGVESVVGVGSEFHCQLPFSATENLSTRQGGSDLAGLRVLVVAESAELRMACNAYLGMWKADVVAAPRLRDATAFLQGPRPHSAQVDVIVIPHVDDVKQVAALREGFIEAGLMPYPRFVVGRMEPEHQQALVRIPEVTLLDVNPVRRAALVHAVAVAAGRASPEMPVVQQLEPVAAVNVPAVEAALASGKLVLVAEDNAANQQVIRRQLHRLGYACEIADDGMKALAMWLQKPYGLLLTDCHMPNMDGFGLTAEIRKREPSTGRRTPIIAITANVLQGEAERCIAAGMDDFLPKPVDLKTLGAMLGKWLADDDQDTNRERSSDELSPSSVDDESRTLDLARIRDVFGDIDDDAREYFRVFINSVQPLIPQFLAEMGEARFGEARETIHKAKGATANAGGLELAGIMHDIEVALAEQRREDAAQRSRDLLPAWGRLARAIAHI